MRAGLHITRLAALSQTRSWDLRITRPTHCLCGHSGYKVLSQRYPVCLVAPLRAMIDLIETVSVLTTWKLHYPQSRQSVQRIPWCLTISKAALKSICMRNHSLQSNLRRTFQCIGHTQKCITGRQIFPISKLGGWKHTTAFHKSFENNRHQTLKRFKNHRCCRNQSIIGNRRRR